METRIPISGYLQQETYDFMLFSKQHFIINMKRIDKFSFLNKLHNHFSTKYFRCLNLYIKCLYNIVS